MNEQFTYSQFFIVATAPVPEAGIDAQDVLLCRRQSIASKGAVAIVMRPEGKCEAVFCREELCERVFGVAVEIRRRL